MNKYLIFTGVVLTLLGNVNCNIPKTDKVSTQTDETLDFEKKDIEKDTSTIEKRKNITDFLPKGYVIFENIYGDLNKDGLEDYIIIIKGTDINNIIKDKTRGEIDRNRRGLIVLLNRNNS